jgi:hypothetical protein
MTQVLEAAGDLAGESAKRAQAALACARPADHLDAAAGEAGLSRLLAQIEAPARTDA